MLVLYAGGTIGMKMTPSGFAPVAGYVSNYSFEIAWVFVPIDLCSQLSERLLMLPAFQDPLQPPCTMPVSPLGKRIRYVIKEYAPVRAGSVWVVLSPASASYLFVLRRAVVGLVQHEPPRLVTHCKVRAAHLN